MCSNHGNTLAKVAQASPEHKHICMIYIVYVLIGVLNSQTTIDMEVSEQQVGSRIHTTPH